jgi:hypothetical protein
VNDRERDFGWPGAVLRAALVVLVAVAMLVYVPHLILTKVSGLSRSSLVGLATTAFVVSLAVLSYALRRLQARRIL